ncbi:hypothetical protein [Thiohalomonas denitrificans]|uniref:Acetyltransferase n=1 Tax=Thiohalomonas denitrificans TaxID=415747 RepID=A0A1G5PN76_9GAMM|nr:hypothetical protein [Thiohalomonas denitrificans]SCZ50661.1 hypothetical protein SAMN03097708_00468 [Thiohalomonas denitrificans]
MDQEKLIAFAEAVRKCCVETAEEAYEQASISGLCGSGAWEVAQGAVKTMDLEPLVVEFLPADEP